MREAAVREAAMHEAAAHDSIVIYIPDSIVAHQFPSRLVGDNQNCVVSQ